MDTTHTSNLSMEPDSTEHHEHDARLDVILPAGGRIAGEFAQMTGTEIKALIALNGQTILRRAIQTLHATGRAGRIVVIGPRLPWTRPARRARTPCSPKLPAARTTFCGG